MSNSSNNNSSTAILRQRPSTASSNTHLNMQSSSSTTTNSRNGHRDEPFLREPGYGISAKGLIDASPQHHGVVMKLHVPVLFSILPTFVQRFLLVWFTSLSKFLQLLPTWKQRYLIVCGSYIYKFKDRSSSIPKGSPIDVESINVEMIVGNNNNNTRGGMQLFGTSLPPGYGSIICVSTFRKKTYFAVVDNEEANVWIQTLHDVRQETIRRRMGHTNHVPYPKSWTYYDSLGQSLLKTKERVRERMEESKLREMELSDLGGGVGDIPRGYHG